jgi:hypothetical protein
VCLIKTNSSLRVHETRRQPSFAWQTGYAAFSVSQSNAPAVVNYICNQDEHHRKVSFQDEFIASVRVRSVGRGDANPVIGELGVRPWHHDFGHVAGYTIRFANGTAAVINGLAVMTNDAPRIVETGFWLDRFVRVMTGDATGATVRRVIAAAAFQAISLEANILNAVKVHRLFLRCSPMAGAAEGGDTARREMTGVKDMRAISVSTLHGLDVLPARTMAPLAADPWDHLLCLEVICGRGGRRVASKASHYR